MKNVAKMRKRDLAKACEGVLTDVRRREEIRETMEWCRSPEGKKALMAMGEDRKRDIENRRKARQVKPQDLFFKRAG